MKLPSSKIGYLYLLLCIAGAVLPTLSNIDFVRAYGPGFDIQSFISLATNNPAAKSLSLDLFISSSSIFLWMYIESRRLEMRNFWIIVLTTFTIAIAFSTPLFLFLRELRLSEIEDK
ncbi:DUF2834 domain-containing protein [Prochlorococcus marinus]|uniref:DUF2834 domain-containing protein n=1 Tax=Prochlorococcus marinus TaxID=1219 RepID=UPI0022B5D84E|nr:DUF2834 domain-containing protein [Prochlorococcus marinus]